MRLMSCVGFWVILASSCGQVSVKSRLNGANATPQNKSPYESTLHPLLVEKCSACHGDAVKRDPAFAVSSPADSLAVVNERFLISSMNPVESRFVTRLNNDKHQCWDGDCQKSSEQMLQRINEYLSSIKSSPKEVGLDMVEFYKKTVYPIVTANCQKCHGESHIVAPFFAVSDAKIGAELLVSAGKVDLVNAEASRLYKRLANERHNCWSDCTENSALMLDAIREWGRLAQTKAREAKSTSELRLSDAESRLPTIDQGVLIIPLADAQLTGRMRVKGDSTAYAGKYVTTEAAPAHPIDGAVRSVTTSLCSSSQPADVNNPAYVRFSENARFPALKGPRKYVLTISGVVVDPRMDGQILRDLKFDPVLIPDVLKILPRNLPPTDALKNESLPADFYYDSAGKRWMVSGNQILGLLRPSQRVIVLDALKARLKSRSFDDRSFIDSISDSNLEQWVKLNLNTSELGEVVPTFGPVTLEGVAIHSDFTLDPTKLVTSTSDATELPLDDRLPGVASFKFEVKSDGFFGLWHRVLTANSGVNVQMRFRDSNGVYRRFFSSNNENNPLGTCYTTTNSTVLNRWTWTTRNSATSSLFWKLEKGIYTLEVIALDNQSKIDKIALYDVRDYSNFNPRNAFDDKFTSAISPKVLSWDLKPLIGQSARLEMEISDFSATAYRLVNPRVISSSGNVQVSGLRVLVNGVRAANDETFAKMDTVATPSSSILQYSGVVLLKQKGPNEDRFSVVFDSISSTSVPGTLVTPEEILPPSSIKCRDLALFNRDVKPILTRMPLRSDFQYSEFVSQWDSLKKTEILDFVNPEIQTCTSCHNSQHIYFPMTEFADPEVFCSQALSRANLIDPSQSILLRGINRSFNHPKIGFIADVDYSSSTGFKSLTFNNKLITNLDGSPMLHLVYSGKFAIMTPEVIQSYLNSAPAGIDQNMILRFLGTPMRIKRIPNPDGTIAMNQAKTEYLYSDVAPWDPLFDHLNYSRWKLDPSGVEKSQALRDKFSSIIQAWISREAALYKNSSK